MKLFILRRSTGEKIYLNLQAATRSELRSILGNEWFTLDISGYYEYFHVNQVMAESEATNNTIPGAVIGGIIGLLGGPGGAVVGASIGGMLGNVSDSSEKTKVERFNTSQ